jgi:hypothetical protein
MTRPASLQRAVGRTVRALETELRSFDRRGALQTFGALAERDLVAAELAAVKGMVTAPRRKVA